MSRATKVIINNQEVKTWNTIGISFPGNNQINTCSISGLPRSMENARFFNTELAVYLNYNDNIPIFRGIVNEITPSSGTISVSASDARSLINSAESFPVLINDSENYDGYTLVQFLHDVIDTRLNKNQTFIGLDMLNDTLPPMSMTDYRTDKSSPYEIATQVLEQVVNDSDINYPYSYALDMVDDGVKSNLVVKDIPNITGSPDVAQIFTSEDGLQSVSYKNINPPNFASVKGVDDIQVIYEHEGRTTGTTGIDIQGDYEDRAKAQYAGMLEVQKQQKWVKDISITVNKGYNIGLYSLIYISTNNRTTISDEISGSHVVQSKNINISPSGVSCTLGLNRPTPKVSQYLF